MNKKFFTLIASALMLVGSVGTLSAQTPTPYWIPVNPELGAEFAPNLPVNDNGLYHLVATSTALATDTVLLTVDEDGKLLAFDNQNYKVSQAYGTSLWCAHVTAPEAAGQNPTFDFINKSTGFPLSVSLTDTTFRYISNPIDTMNVQEGNLNGWRFSGTYETSLETWQPLITYFRPDSVVALALSVSGTDTTVILKSYKASADMAEVFADDSVLRFSIVKPAPLILDAEEFNTLLATKTSDFVQLKFTPDHQGSETWNPFTQYKLKARDVATQPGYVNLERPMASTTDTLKWLRVDTAFQNSTGIGFLNFKFDTIYNNWNTIANPIANFEALYDFQLKYYVSNDSLAIDVRGAFLKQNFPPSFEPRDTTWYDQYMTLATDPVHASPQYPQTDSLHVKLQNLTPAGTQRIVTIGTAPANTIINLGLGGCEPVDDNRTTLASGLYFITLKNSGITDKQFKIVHINQSIIWAKEDNDSQLYGTIQDFGHMPATQWVVEQIRTTNDPNTYRVNIYNREYPAINAKNVQLYRTENGNLAMPKVVGTYFNAADELSFVEVKTEKPNVPQAYTDPYLGYFHNDSLKLAEKQYAFNYLSGLAKDGYLNLYNSATDSLVRVQIGESTNFELETATNYKDEGYYGYIGVLDSAKYTTTNKLFEELRRTAYVIRVKDANLLMVDGKYMIKIFNPATGEDMYAVSDLDKRDSRVARFFLKENNRVAEENVAGGTPFYSLVDAYNPALLTNADGLYTNFYTRINADTLWYESAYNGLNNNAAGYRPANGYVRAAIKDGSLVMAQELQTMNVIRASAFAMRPANNYLYRRFDGGTYGPLVEPYKGGADTADINSPLWLKFAKYNNWGTDGSNFLAENSVHNVGVPGYVRNFRDSLVYDKTISFGGLYNKYQYPEAEGKMSYTFYVDTAYVRYETIMPQYMLALRPSFGAKDTVWCTDVHHNGQTHQDPDWINCPHTIIPYPMTKADWLFNAQDSVNVGNIDYQGKFSYGAKDLTRLAFVHGIHANDTFYVLRDPVMIAKEAKQIKKEELFRLPAYDKHYLGNNTHYKQRWATSKYTEPRKLAGTADLSKDEINGKSMVFQFRLIDEQNRRFLFETTSQSDEIGPKIGQWVKFQNEVPVIGQWATDVSDALQSSPDVFDVTDKPGVNDGAISNEEVATTKVQVVAGYGEVTVYNAANKKVTVSNVLGQTLANTVANSDQATIQLPKGIVVVAVDGEKAIKAIVK